MDTIDFVSADCLEIGDTIEWQDEILIIRGLDDLGDVINLLCESLDSGDIDVLLSLSPSQVVPIKGFYYDDPA